MSRLFTESVQKYSAFRSSSKATVDRHTARLLGCLIFINALALAPLLTTGFIADDMLNSQIRGHMVQTGRSLWGVTSFYAMQWLRNEGRLFPLAFYNYSAFYVLGNVFWYKCFVLGVILGSVAAFFVFLRKFTRSDLIPVITLLVLPIMFQFRALWDPMLAFCAQYPLITLVLFCSLTLFLRAVDEDAAPALRFAVLLFVCSELIFEVTYPMFLVYSAVAYFRLKSIKSAARASWLFFASTFCLGLISALLRSHATAIMSTYQVHLDVPLIIKTYVRQMVGTVPFSYVFFDPDALFRTWASKWHTSLIQLLPGVLLLAGITAFSVCRRLTRILSDQQESEHTYVLTLGALLVVLSPVLISLSPKFQAQTWGDAYLPVYIGCFGLCLILAVAVERISRWLVGRWPESRWMQPVFLCFWLLLFGVNFRDNWLVAKVMNETVWAPRVLLEKALDSGLLLGVGPKAVLLVQGADTWDNGDEYALKTGMRLSVYRLSENRDLTPIFESAGGNCDSAMDPEVCDFAADSPVYAVQIRHLSDGTGAVLLARVKRAIQSKNSIRGLLSSEVKAYFQLPVSVHPLAVAVSGREMPQRGAVNSFRASDTLQTLNEGPDWKVVSLHGDSVFDVLSLNGDIEVEHEESSVVTSKSRNEFELHGTGRELVHVGYQSGKLGKGVELSPLAFENDMCIEVLVTPGDSQRRYADILSNHWVDSRGLAIEQIDTHNNQYSVTFGTGKGWMAVGTFNLTGGRRSYISLQVKDGEARLYVDGNRIARTVLTDPIASSPHSVWLGNWKGGDRPFNGWIDEVLIAKGAKSEEAVLSDARRLASGAPASESPKQLLLQGNEAAILHKGFGPQGGESFVLPGTIRLPESYTLELLVRPASSQHPYATIISNHPGKKGFQGFSLEQVEKRTNHYNLSFGNGKTWMAVGELLITPGDLHYVAVTRDKRHVNTYLDGHHMAEKLLEADPAASEYPMTIGNWFNKDRPFNGAIQEIRITPVAASAKTIADRADSLRKAYGP